MQPAIEVKDLRKSYGKNKVLRGVDFTVSEGTIFALLGSNGAGKTTIINIMATLLEADNGSVAVGGYDLARQPEKIRASISLTGQFAAVDEVLTARENLALMSDLRHIRNTSQTVTDLLKKFELTDAADRRVATFSGGMRRRLDIAMSLIGSPAIIFLDEPTTGLDPEARNDMWDTIKELAGGGTTVFLTTQYLEEADELADTIALLHKGIIVASGTAAELKKLVPNGLVSLTFHNEAQLVAATRVLQDYKPAQSKGLTLTVMAENSAARIAELFIRLRDAHIEPADFSQKVPTLDDVFFKLISSKKEKK